MQSSKYKYRIITAHHNAFKIQFKNLSETAIWSPYPGLYSYIEEAREEIARMVEDDDHEFQIVEE